jgi:hypothetical protein
MSGFHGLNQPHHRLSLFHRWFRLFILAVKQQSEHRRIVVEEEINHSKSAAFSMPGWGEPHLSDTAQARDHDSYRRIGRQRGDQRHPIIGRQKSIGSAGKDRGFDHRMHKQRHDPLGYIRQASRRNDPHIDGR